MADSKITALTSLAAPSADDLLAIVDDPAGTPVTKKLAISALQTYLGTALQSSGHFGTGIDGDATISGPTSLTKDTYYHDLTINAGQVLTTAGFRLFVSGTLTFGDAASGIDNAGGAGGAGGDATSGAAGGAGAAGAAAPAGNMTASAAGLIGKAGVRRTTTQGQTPGTAGTAAVKSIYLWPNQPAGKAAGDGVTTAGGTGAGGAAAAGATSDDTGTTTAARAWRAFPDCLFPQRSILETTGTGTAITGANLQGQAASGSSGGVSSVTTNTTSIASGGSGGSGGGGGAVVVCARVISGAGYIRSSGGVGGIGGAAFGAGTVYAAGGSSGGNGGPGGVLVVVYGLLAGGCTTAQFTAPGGAGGAAGVGLALGAGSSKTDGTQGNTGVAGVVNLFQLA